METWKTIFTEINKKEYFQDLIQFINNENRHHVVFPPKHDIFSAFRLTPFELIKVVIFGQDPYPNKGQAMGLAFGVNKGVDLPPSLRNIYKEIENEFDVKMNYQSMMIKTDRLYSNMIFRVLESELTLFYFSKASFFALSLRLANQRYWKQISTKFLTMRLT